jgi:hypothetical protein
MIRFMMITNDPVLARRAEAAGIERIFVDTEIIGKQERQGHLDTLISKHSLEDIRRIKPVLENAELIARLNPMHAGTESEIETAIANGADILMLPMVHSAAEVAEFAGLVAGRASVIPLVETRAAVDALEQIVSIAGVDEIYIGLNDLHLDMGLSFMFEPVADGLLDIMAQTLRRAGLPFGFGGVARVGEGVVPGEMVLGEHARLGSTAVILSRTFSRNLPEGNQQALAMEVGKLRSAYQRLTLRSSAEIRLDHQLFNETVTAYAQSKKR